MQLALPFHQALVERLTGRVGRSQDAGIHRVLAMDVLELSVDLARGSEALILELRQLLIPNPAIPLHAASLARAETTFRSRSATVMPTAPAPSR
jgi:hypothetical protein